jgi:hypothetical protein
MNKSDIPAPCRPAAFFTSQGLAEGSDAARTYQMECARGMRMEPRSLRQRVQSFHRKPFVRCSARSRRIQVRIQIGGQAADPLRARLAVMPTWVRAATRGLGRPSPRDTGTHEGGISTSGPPGDAAPHSRRGPARLLTGGGTGPAAVPRRNPRVIGCSDGSSAPPSDPAQ